MIGKRRLLGRAGGWSESKISDADLTRSGLIQGNNSLKKELNQVSYGPTVGGAGTADAYDK